MLEEGSESSESRLSVLGLRLNLSRRDVRRWVSVVVDPVVGAVELVGAVVPVVPVVGPVYPAVGPVWPVPVDVVVFGALPTVREPSRSESTKGMSVSKGVDEAIGIRKPYLLDQPCWLGLTCEGQHAYP